MEGAVQFTNCVPTYFDANVDERTPPAKRGQQSLF